MYNQRLHFHFTGIGGAGMSGIAEVLLTHGFGLSGTDTKESEVTAKLRRLGIPVEIGHAAGHVPEHTSMLVYSSAVPLTNPELVEAKRRGIPVLRRAEVLAELMRLKFGVGVAGSHGKTTTTSMIAQVLERGNLDPTVIIGGQLKASGSGSRVGKGNYLVAETDESDRSFLLLKPTIAVVTNIDAEHLSAYRSLSELEESFELFVQAVPFYGLAVLCIDDRRVRELAQKYGRRKTTFGFSPDANLQPRHVRQTCGISRFEVHRDGELLCEVTLPVPGRHMISNSLAAVAVGLEFGLAPQQIANALDHFQGVTRRLEIVGEVNDIVVMNDYGHHPAEVRATLRAIREGWGDSRRIVVAFQPHRYTRTRDCFGEFLECFEDADELLLLDIYAAHESPINGIDGEVLFKAIAHKNKTFTPTNRDVLEQLTSRARPRDFIVCLGAGTIGQLPELLLERLRSDRKAA